MDGTLFIKGTIIMITKNFTLIACNKVDGYKYKEKYSRVKYNIDIGIDTYNLIITDEDIKTIILDNRNISVIVRKNIPNIMNRCFETLKRIHQSYSVLIVNGKTETQIIEYMSTVSALYNILKFAYKSSGDIFIEVT